MQQLSHQAVTAELINIYLLVNTLLQCRCHHYLCFTGYFPGEKPAFPGFICPEFIELPTLTQNVPI